MNIFKSYVSRPNQPKIHFNISFAIAAAFLLILTIAMFGDVLFTSDAAVLSSPGSDIFLQFAYWREFGFSQLRQGNLPLWNPHLFSGAPYLGGFQSALFYPPNLLYLFLPLSKAINISIALHVFLAGIFMYLWASHRRLHPLACFLSSVLLMFCGAHFLNIYAGHVPHLCTMIWAPLLFLSIDGLFEDRSFGWVLLGMFAVTMQTLAGFPQHLFYTAVIAGLYSALCIVKAEQRTRIILGIIAVYVGAFLLTAVQVLTGIQAGRESVRSSGIRYSFAAMFAFPPENFLTLLVPNFFGNNTSLAYWGRSFLWEMSLFLSITGFILALYGAVYGNKNVRRFSVTTALVLLVLALGSNTPLFRLLYLYVPGFGMFRGTSKFIFQASLFIILLAGIGLDHIIRFQRVRHRTIFAVIASGFLLVALAFSLRHSVIKNPQGLWYHIMQAVYATHECSLGAFSPQNYADLTFIRQAGLLAFEGILIAAGIFLLVSILLFLCRFSGRIPYLLMLLAVVEIFVFARASRPTSDLNMTRPQQMQEFVDEHPGDYRILYPENPNIAMSLRMRDIWGYDPAVLRRYAEFIAFTQGRSPDNINEYLLFSRFDPLFRMLRCRYYFSRQPDGFHHQDAGTPLPRLLLLQDWMLIPDRDRIFAAMNDVAFDPQQKVILESAPNPEPVESDRKGTVRILDSSTDHLAIEANLPSAAILLITDTYSEAWRARPLPPSSQQKYSIMPANYILQAIPLSEGYHRIRLEYLPLAFQVGKWISLISTAAYFGLLIYWGVRKIGSLSRLLPLSGPAKK